MFGKATGNTNIAELVGFSFTGAHIVALFAWLVMVRLNLIMIAQGMQAVILHFSTVIINSFIVEAVSRLVKHQNGLICPSNTLGEFK